MSPLQVRILLTYHAGGAHDFRDGDFTAPAVRSAIDGFVRDKMIELEPDPIRAERTYRLTDRGEFFVKHICELDLPEAEWHIPEKPF